MFRTWHRRSGRRVLCERREGGVSVEPVAKVSSNRRRRSLRGSLLNFKVNCRSREVDSPCVATHKRCPVASA